MDNSEISTLLQNAEKLREGEKPRLKRRPRKVDFYERRDDHDCVLYASLGFSTQFIIERTGLSPSQVTYRLRKAGLTSENNASRLDFRNGRSPFCSHVLSVVKPVADRQLIKFLNAHL